MLTPGSRIGPYEVVSSLGAGGMGEVYRATDTKLKRQVAIKILPPSVADDPERLARFQREAEVLASLNHPNIAHVYGLEEGLERQLGKTLALVMELVEGPTLADRIAAGAIPIKDALPIAKQIAEALCAAHDQGIVHRDLKPANIKVRDDGTVKVLDFGLAKALDPKASSATADLTNSPTMTSPAMTAAGVILGTAAYMSPEQARGRAVDKRTDVWAFGCVLYEMLTGRRAFEGETVSDVIAVILEREPAWDRLPGGTPPAITRLLRRCLTKDARNRLRDIADVRFAIEDASTPSDGRTDRIAPTRRTPWRLTTAVAFLTAVAAAVLTWTLRPAAVDPPAAAVTRVLIAAAEPVPTDVRSLLAISPDGRRVAYVAGEGSHRHLFLRSLDQFESVAIQGTEGADFPVFSPDGQWLAFVVGDHLKKISIAGGSPTVLAELVNGGGQGVAWGPKGDALFFSGTRGRGISRVSAAGGTPTEATRLAAGETVHRSPDVMPDGNALLFTDIGGAGGGRIYAQSLVTGERHLVVEGRSARYLPSGHLLYVNDGLLYGVAFDPVTLTTSGDPVQLLDNILQTLGGEPQVSFSASGAMVYAAASSTPQDALVWVDANGAETPVGQVDGLAHQPRLSPDGRRVAVISGGTSSAGDVLLLDRDRGTWNRFTSDGHVVFSAWTADSGGLTLTSVSDQRYRLFTRHVNGAEDELLTTNDTIYPFSWQRDGDHLAVVTVNPETTIDISVVDRRHPNPPTPFINTASREGAPAFSPDGELMAYVSDKSGRFEVYVRPYPGPGEELTISDNGGNEPQWARSTGQLFYRHDDAVMVVDIARTPALRPGKPRLFLEKRYQRSDAFWPNFDVAPDGKRLLMVKHNQQSSPTHFNVVLNWSDELRARIKKKASDQSAAPARAR